MTYPAARGKKQIAARGDFVEKRKPVDDYLPTGPELIGEARII